MHTVMSQEGLSEEQVLESRKRYGSNQITKKKRKSFSRQFLEGFGDPIIKILLAALVVNVLFLFRDANWYETLGIAAALFLATFVSALSEYGSESAFERLQEEASRTRCRVKRAEGVLELPIDQVVKGDLLLLQAGERVPADGEMLSGFLTVDQSALNGETKEAKKRPRREKNGQAGKEGFLSEHRLFRGSVVCAGNGVMEAEQVGDHTFYGGLALEVQEETIESPLKERLTKLAVSISRLGYGAAALVFGANLFYELVVGNGFQMEAIAAHFWNVRALLESVLESLMLAITVLVMAVPEGLPMMITVVLSSNMRRMLKDQVLVRKLVGIETSGSLNLLLTDKTGTLTKGRLQAVCFLDGEGQVYADFGALRETALYAPISRSCYYNNESMVSTQEGKRTAIGGNATDRALLEFVLSEAFPEREKELLQPFQSERKFAVTRLSGVEHPYLIKGAPDVLLPCCGWYYDRNGKKQPFTKNTELHRELQRQAEAQVRLLALCESDRNFTRADGGQQLTLVGILGMKDELRPEAGAAVGELTGAGIQVIMITGDNRETAVAIGKEAGLLNGWEKEAVLTSKELQALSDEALKKRLPKLRIVARALPSDKSRLVWAAQELSLVVGMTGDGVNDAPALKKADVGFAMGDGTEIAREAGDIVILDNNISSIAKAVLYGRTVFKSIRKFVVFQLTVNLCAVAVSVIGPFIGVESPVTVIQMLWLNMIMDTLGGLAFAGEAALPEYMKEKPKSRNEEIITASMYEQILFMGVYTVLLSLAFLKLPILQRPFRQEEAYILTAFFALFIFMGIFNSFNARTERINLLAHLGENRAFLWIMGLIAVIQVVFIYYGGSVFRTAGLTISELAAVVLLAFTVVLADVFRKLYLRGKSSAGGFCFPEKNATIEASENGR